MIKIGIVIIIIAIIIFLTSIIIDKQMTGYTLHFLFTTGITGLLYIVLGIIYKFLNDDYI